MITNIKVQKVPGLYLGTTCSFQASLGNGEAGKEGKRARSDEKRASTVSKQDPQQFFREPEGAPSGTQGRLAQIEQLLRMHYTVSLKTASWYRADGAEKHGQARATWDNDCQATHIALR